jgi:tetraacyldisaccharide 4'-kinase
MSAGTLPLELGFRAVVRLRNELYDRRLLRAHRAAVPVVSVGNLSVGGTGKTPVSAWLVRRLILLGRNPALVARGYGRDELLVHRELNPDTPIIAAPDRIAGVSRAVAAGADCVVLDDGFQHRRLARDFDIVLISAESWRGLRRMLPRGPWREPIGSLRRADFVIVTRKVASHDRGSTVRDELESMGIGCPIGIASLRNARLIPIHAEEEEILPESLAAEPVLAVSTLADPGAFLEWLEACGARVEAMTFPDHHEFSETEIQEIRERAGGRFVVMTRKEAVKLRPRLIPAGIRALMAEQVVEMESGGSELEAALRRAIGGGE